MKHLNCSNVLQAVVLLLLTFLPGPTGPVSRGADVNDNLYNYLQVLRSDLNSLKVDLINSIMKLSVDDAKTFWPIYRDYENELGRQSIDRAELVAAFVQAHEDGTFDNLKAKDMAQRWFKGQRARLDLLEKYHAKIETALNPVQAGQFLQIENQLGLFVDVAIASEMPTVGAKGKQTGP